MPYRRALWFMVVASGCFGAGEAPLEPDATPAADAAAPPCGPGTHDMGGVCAPDAEGYELRIGSPQVSADGYSKIPLLAIGTRADGTPALDEMVLSTSRAGAGAFSPPMVTLTPLGATTYYTPCSSATPDCVGPVTLMLARGSAPETVVAKLDITLVTPTGVGSPAPCLVSGNVLFMDGVDDFIYSGTQTIRNGNWSVTSYSPRELTVHVDPSDNSQGLWWDIEFSTEQLGQPLMEQTYEMAERAPFASPGHPGLDLSGDGRGCNTLTGRFQIEDITIADGALTSFTATYEQHCEGGLGVVRGCVHYEH